MNLIIMSTVYDTPVFRASLQSLVNTTPEDDVIVVVEDGLFKEEKCREFTNSILHASNLYYLKYPNHNSMGQMFRWVYDEMDNEFDGLSEFSHIILSHNDLMFPSNWSQTLNEARDRLETAGMTDKCPVINLSHNEYAFKNYKVESNTTYGTIHKDLESSKFYSADIKEFFGLSQDRWNMNRVGRLSPFISLNRDFFNEINFCDTGHGYDCEILWSLSRGNQWSIWINNVKLLHFRPTESGNDTVLNHKEGKGADHYNWMEKNVKQCEKMFGIDLERWLDIEFGLVKQMYKEDIENTFNHKLSELPSLDYIFQEVKEAIA